MYAIALGRCECKLCGDRRIRARRKCSCVVEIPIEESCCVPLSGVIKKLICFTLNCTGQSVTVS